VNLRLNRHGLTVVAFCVVTSFVAELVTDLVEKLVSFLPVRTVHSMDASTGELEEVVLPPLGAAPRSLDRAWCKCHHLVEVLSEVGLTVSKSIEQLNCTL